MANSNPTPTSPSPEADTKEVPCPKEWLQPRVLENFLTFIDHDCTLDAQGYPLYPNGQTVFVKLPTDDIKNFATVGFAKHTCSETSKAGDWKVTRVYCLGVLLCDQEACKWAGSPPTSRKKTN